MTRITSRGQAFVHASDIQLLNREAVDRILDWRPDTVLTAGPPMYLKRLDGVAKRFSDSSCAAPYGPLPGGRGMM